MPAAGKEGTVSHTEGSGHKPTKHTLRKAHGDTASCDSAVKSNCCMCVLTCCSSAPSHCLVTSSGSEPSKGSGMAGRHVTVVLKLPKTTSWFAR